MGKEMFRQIAEYERNKKTEERLEKRLGMVDLDPVTADILSKALSSDRVDSFIYGMGMLSIPSLVDQSKISGLKTIAEQNFVIIKQNDEQMKLQRESNDLQRQQNELQSAVLRELKYNTDKMVEFHT